MKRFSILFSILLFSAFSLFAQQKGAAFQFEDANATYDFGKVKEGQKVTHDYVFKNVGNQPLQIMRVDASCGCTTPDWPKRPIMPGQTSKISVTYDSKDNVGKTLKEITIQSNAVVPGNKPRYTITLKGEVVK